VGHRSGAFVIKNGGARHLLPEAIAAAWEEPLSGCIFSTGKHNRKKRANLIAWGNG
jgi:hypothetical protein